MKPQRAGNRPRTVPGSIQNVYQLEHREAKDEPSQGADDSDCQEPWFVFDPKVPFGLDGFWFELCEFSPLEITIPFFSEKYQLQQVSDKEQYGTKDARNIHGLLS
mmetsp:Transcript_92046/g.187357  ORF Transcript_92046/g.187357 Transcript_92046/m.187357 type:complete len:105 (-) Transcript_92046:116-430(-)